MEYNYGDLKYSMTIVISSNYTELDASALRLFTREEGELSVPGILVLQ